MTVAAAGVVVWLVAASAVWRAAAAARRSRIVQRRLAGDQPSDDASALTSTVLGVAVAVAVLATVGVVPAAVLLGALAAGRQVHRHVAAGVAAERDGDALADVVDAVARSFRAGLSPAAAVQAAATAAPRGLRTELAAAVRRAEHGVPLAAALDDWAETTSVDGADLVATAYAITSQAGGDHGRALLTVADTLRERRALRRELRALSTQARSSAAVIAVAPLAFAAVAAAVDRTTADVLFGSPLGLACVALGVALDIAGWRWMDRITRSPA